MSDTSQGEGWWQASDGKWYAPEQHPDHRPPPPPPASDTAPASDEEADVKPGLRDRWAAVNERAEERSQAIRDKAEEKRLGSNAGPSTYMIREDGKNGTVEILDDRIIRTRKKHLGKDDVQTIPVKAITAVSHDRKTLGTDIVHLTVGAVSYEWKVSNAERMVADLHERMF